MHPRTGAPLHVAFVTVGDLARQTGGYLYHARVHALLREAGHTITDCILSPDASWDAQRQCDASLADAAIAQTDVVLVDALACLAAAPALPRWHTERLIVAMVHELPTAADPALADVPDIVAAERTLLDHADHVITVSAFNAALLYERGVAPEHLSIAAPGSDRLPFSDRDSTGAASANRGDLQVLCLAQWIPRKGIDVLVQAWQQALSNLPADTPSPTLHLVGERTADTPYTAQVDARIANDATIRVHGALSDADLEALWPQIDLFVLPSRAEGYGMVYAEALLRGVPVIATDVGPIPEVVGDGGLLVPVDDVDALTAALRMLLMEPEQRRALAVLAAARGRQLPRWSDTAAAIENALATAMLFLNPPAP